MGEEVEEVEEGLQTRKQQATYNKVPAGQIVVWCTAKPSCSPRRGPHTENTQSNNKTHKHTKSVSHSHLHASAVQYRVSGGQTYVFVLDCTPPEQLL